ncbi:MAG: alpha-amylase family protein [Thermoguttaceae bacterium]
MSLKRYTAAAVLGVVAAAILTTTLTAAEAVKQQGLPDAEAAKSALSKLPIVDDNPAPETSLDAFIQTRWQQSAQQKRELTRDVIWLTHEPLDFLMRRGEHFDDEADRYQRMCDPENLKRMAGAGVRWGRLFFYKGFGLEYEKPHIEQAKRTAEIMHQLGMKVALYMAGTMFTETLYHEVPEAKNWEQRDQNDRWVPYGIQTYRHYACPNEPAYRKYLKSILRIGVEDLHADEISFDNVMLQPEPKSCRCPRCIQAFHDFLRQRYPTKESVMRRFGLPEVDWIRVSEWDSPTQPDGLTALNDPVLQEWVRFRCESLANYTNDLHDYVKGLNPNVVVHLNIKGLYSFNRYWTNAVYHPLFANHVDVLSFDTGGYDARIDPATGALVSQIRSYKMARRLGTSCEDSMHDELRAAVHMAFGYQKPVAGYPGAPFGAGAHNVFTPIMEFFRQYNDRYYTGTDNVADVAVLRNWPSMAYSINSAYFPATLMEQVLIQYKIPFDLLFEEQLDRIGRYGAVILAGQECVSDTQIKTLLQYVRGGGALVLTGNTAQYNQWRERRRTNPLLPERSEGKGRIIYIPEIVRADARSSRMPVDDQDPEPGAGPSKSQRMSPAQWVLPKNHREIFHAVVEALPKGTSITTEAPLTTVMELLNRPATRETMAHFINFDRKNKLAPFPVALRRQFPGRVKSVTCFSPDADDPAPLSFQESGESVSFIVPATRLYSMIVVAHE